MIANADQSSVPKDPPKSLEPLSADLVTDSQKVACLQVQGDEALKKGNYQEAVHSYSQGLMLDPKNCELLSCRAVAFIQMKRYEDARVDGEALIQIQPEFPQNYYLLSLANGCLGNLQKAFWSMLRCLDLDPMHQNDLVKELYKITNKLCNTEIEDNYFDDKGLDEVLLEIGSLLCEASLHDLCIQVVSSAVQLYQSTMSDSIRMQFYMIHATSYSATNEMDMAKTAYENCLKLALKLSSIEEIVKCYEGLAEVHREIGHPEEAIQYLLELLAIGEHSEQQPSNQQSSYERQPLSTSRREFWSSERVKAAYLNLSEAYCLIHQYQKALTFGKKYLEHIIGGPLSSCSHDITSAYYQVAKLQEKLGLYSDSVNSYQQYCDLNKVLGNSTAAAEAHGAIGSVHVALGNYDLAIMHAHKSFNMSRAGADRKLLLAALIRLGDINSIMENFEEASSWYEQAWDHNRMGDAPKLRCQTALGLAEVYKGTGHYQHALYFYEQALEAAEEANEGELMYKCKFKIACCCQFSYSAKDLAKGCKAVNDVIPHYHWLSRKAIVEGIVQPEEITHVLVESYDVIQTILVKIGEHVKALQYAEAGRRHRFLTYALMEEEQSAWNNSEDQSLPSSIPSLEKLYSIVDATSGSVLYYSLVKTGLLVWMLKAKQGLVYFHATNGAVSEAVHKQICQFLLLLKNRSLLYETEARNIPIRLKKTMSDKLYKSPWTSHLSCKNSKATCGLPEDGMETELWKQMYLLLLGPLNKLLDDVQEGSDILIVPDQYLIQIPFANLPDAKNKTLGERFWVTLAPSLFAVEVVANLTEDFRHKIESRLPLDVKSGHVPTMTMLQHMGSSQQELHGLQKVGLMDSVSHLVHCTSTNTLVASSPYVILPFKQVFGKSRSLVVGSPHFPSALSLWGRVWKPWGPLIGAQKEVIKVAEYLQTEAIMGEQATKKRVLSELPQLTVVHIATYGSWEEGVLLFTPHPPPAAGELVDERSYLLTIPEILELKLKAKVVVLSSCGDGGTIQDSVPPLILPSAFLRAGASSVLMQIKSVPQQASLTFYHHFYVALWYGSLVSYAVEYAKQQMQNDARFGRYWCSFVLLGLDTFISLQDIKHDMLQQAMENAEQEVAERDKKDWLNPAPYAPPVPDREDLLLQIQKSIEELLVNQGSMSAVLKLLHMLMSEACRRLSDTNADHCTVKLTANIINIPGVYSMLKLLGFHFQSLVPYPPKVDARHLWLARGKANRGSVEKNFMPTFSHAHPVAAIFPHWNPDKLLGVAQQVVAALIDLSACSQCVNALIWILPLTCDILEQLITLLKKSQSPPAMCPRLTEKKQWLHFGTSPTSEISCRSLQVGSLNLFLALHPRFPQRQRQLDPGHCSSTEVREQQSTQEPQETIARREGQSTQSPQQAAEQGEELSPQDGQETLPLTSGQMEQSRVEGLPSTDELSVPRSQESLTPEEKQSSQEPQEPLTCRVSGNKGGPGSQDTHVDKSRKIRQGPQGISGNNTRGKKTKQCPGGMAARKNVKNRHRASETSLASDTLSKQDAHGLATDIERTVAATSKVCLNTLKPLLVLRHQVMMQAPWLSVRATSNEVQVKRGLVNRLASLHSQQQAHIRDMELWHKKTLKNLEQKPERSEPATQACCTKVKVRGPRTPSSNRTPLDPPKPVPHNVAENLALRRTAHKIITEQDETIRQRHRAEVNDLFLPFIDPVPDTA
ncbi:tetratricopeptide repeat protein 28-like isoform X1 [Leucoraja erinacea]|uniref:tetratricopeptide repeat protein 28-like isoform X1 n=1 Tax=Leucoraja erinaceus TaxID=7782 RepID=UPI0024537465|nr:tetratricopeptide repeat protein 28-like isoform X1 [Leucoraja erinacea]XP_055516382.1 tetratricopeptide repeat protein 28-like isoform X1 [Leucoraja erinacea]